MKLSFVKIGSGIAAAAAMVMPLSMHAASTLSGGLILPAGVLDQFIEMVTEELWPAVTATLFQDQIVGTLVVVAAVGITIGIMFWIIKKFGRAHR